MFSPSFVRIEQKNGFFENGQCLNLSRFSNQTLGIKRNYNCKHANAGGIGHDRTSTSEPYCDKDPKLEKKMRPALNFSTHLYSPNIDFAEDPEAEMYWLQYADFYDWPHIQHFDNLEHLKEMLLMADLDSIHQLMVDELKFRKFKVTQNWCDISDRISR